MVSASNQEAASSSRATNESSLDFFFRPKSVAVVGASNKKGKVGHSVIRNLIEDGYKGKIFPVNIKEKEIMGLKCYSSILDIEESIDICVVVVPAKHVLSVAEDCGKKGVKGLIVITAGFKEVGHEGAKLEDRLVETCQKYNMRMLGPNVVGMSSFISEGEIFNASFAPRAPIPGKIAFLSQSGAMLTSILDWSLNEGIGFSKFISLGNKSDLNETDFIEALMNDPDTEVILCYLENIIEGERFMDIAKQSTKPIVILKSGTSAAGARAASSHTGALAGADVAYTKAFQQAGVIRAETIQDLFDFAVSLSNQPTPKGKGVAIITNAGGPGIVCTDAVEREGLKLANFTKETIEKLRENLPAEAAVFNPVDVIGDAKADRYDFAIKTCLEDPNVHMAIVIMAPTATTEFIKTAQCVVKYAQSFPEKPVVGAFIGGHSVVEAMLLLKDAGIPCYSFPEQAVKALKGLALHSEYRQSISEMEDPPNFPNINKKKVQEIFEKVLNDGRKVLLEPEAIAVVENYGIPVPRTKLSTNPREAVKYANEIGYPVVMKVASPQIFHKSDIGGVVVGVKNDNEVRRHYREIVDRTVRAMPNAVIYGIEIQQMSKLPDAKELIIGMNRDPTFGPMLMTGFGGIFVNFLQDVSFRINHKGITRKEALEMISETRVYRLLRGVRGQAPSDIESLIDVICRIGKLVRDFDNINEIDINPIFVFQRGNGSLALDVKITLR
ncbi:MAG: acetate--CoA ligase alpha subunit [Candidatus Helarchaeales archaeon]